MKCKSLMLPWMFRPFWGVAFPYFSLNYLVVGILGRWRVQPQSILGTKVDPSQLNHRGEKLEEPTATGKSSKTLETTQDRQNPSCQNKNEAFHCDPSSFKWMEMVKVTYLNLIRHDLVRYPREKVTERKI